MTVPQCTLEQWRPLLLFALPQWRTRCSACNHTQHNICKAMGRNSEINVLLGEISGDTLAGLKLDSWICQWTKWFDPNPGVFISGDDLCITQSINNYNLKKLLSNPNPISYKTEDIEASGCLLLLTLYVPIYMNSGIPKYMVLWAETLRCRAGGTHTV